MADVTEVPEKGAPEHQTDDPTPKEPAKGSETDGDRLPDDHPVVKALKKANEEAAAARLKVKEYEDRDKSELDLTVEQMDEARAERDAAVAELARYKAALAHGLSDEDLDLLGSGTPEEIEARAERLAQRLGDQRGPRKPAPDPSQGARGGPRPTTPADSFTAFADNL